MKKTTFLVTPELIASGIHLPADVKISNTIWENGLIRIEVEGENIPDKKECEPIISRIDLSGDIIYRWNWDK